MNLKAIDYENSGAEVIENFNLEELRKHINKHIFEEGQYYNNADKEKKDIIRKFEKYTFSAY